MANCPHCSHAVNSTAIVDAFNEPANWQFWGTAGQRWIVCRGDSYIHFRVKLNGRDNHRLAIIREMAADWLDTQATALASNEKHGMVKRGR